MHAGILGRSLLFGVFIQTEVIRRATRILSFFGINRIPRALFSSRRSVLTMELEVAAGDSTPAVSEVESTRAAAAKNGKRKKDEESDGNAGGKKRRGTGGKTLRPGERYVPPPQKRNPGVSFSQEHFSETSYYFEGGLRKVYPYYFDFKTYCKGRWIGKSLLEVFKSEFRAESVEYYQEAAKEGRIRLNEAPVEDLSVVLKGVREVWQRPNKKSSQ